MITVAMKPCLAIGIVAAASISRILVDVCNLQGLEVEVRTEDRMGLLSEITRVFRENSLSIIRAAISTKDTQAEDMFYVSDAYGNPVDGRTMDAVGEQIGHAVLWVKKRDVPPTNKPVPEGGAVSVLGSLLKGSLQGFNLIRSYS